MNKYTRQMPFRSGLLIAALLLLGAGLTPAAHAGMNRFNFASQQDFGAKQGFYLDLENDSQGSELCRLSTLKLILGVGSGKEWRFLNVNPHWEVGKTYTLHATIGKDGATLSRDGEQLAKAADATLKPTDSRFTAGERLGWASDPAEYGVHQLSLKITIDGKAQEIPLPPVKSLPAYLFEPQTPVVLPDFRVTPGASVTVDATFRLEVVPTDLKPLAPFVDKYGQSRYSDWSDKVKTDADLTQSMADEAKRNVALAGRKGYDAYGGYSMALWHEKSTGFYRTVRHEGKWWLISPDGNPTFYIGLCTAPALAWEKTPVTGREFLFEALPTHEGENGTLLWSRGVWGGDGDIDYGAIHSMNLLAKYGTKDWQSLARTSLVQRLDAWGFSGLGKWCEPVGHKPIVSVLGHGDVPNIARHPDIFDPAVQKTFADSLRRQIDPGKNDPTILGWSLGNEFDEIITHGEIEDIINKHADSPVALALKKQVPDGDIEKMRRFYADAYYGFIYKTIKEIDPNHLYCGFWIVPNWWENEQDWRLIAPHCDIIGYDRYSDTFADESLARLIKETDKPILCGEFSFPSWYDGTHGYGLYSSAWARSDAEAGDKYTKFVTDAANNPWCVGVLWFQYRDQPITGRGPGRGASLTLGEHYAFGMVDITDRPKWDLVTRVRAANQKAVPLRLLPLSPTH